MIKVKDIMTKKLITVSPETEIVHATKILLENRINGVPVTDETGKLVGILCQSDLIAQQKKLPVPSFFTLLDGLVPLTSMKYLESQVQKIAAISVAQAMTPNPVVVRPDSSIEEVAAHGSSIHGTTPWTIDRILNDSKDTPILNLRLETMHWFYR